MAALLPYAAPPVYHFPDAAPFSGRALWNPYQQVHGRWRRANFHAHGESWGGVTNGAQTDAQVVSAYWAAGYDVAEVSDYERIADAADTIPVYEHGYSVGKHHQLAIGARSVVWWDFPFWQGVNQKQFIIERLRPTTELVSLNHPSRLSGYSLDDMRQLTDYDLIEVANGRFMVEDRWDAALSAGRPAFALAGDDTHDVNDPNRMGIAWNMIDAETTSPSDVIGALRAGRSYIAIRMVDGKPGVADVALDGVTVNDQTMTVTLTGAPAQISFIGQDGNIRANATGMSASYSFTPADTYIRTKILTSRSLLLLNPVIRSSADNDRPMMPALAGESGFTWPARLGVIAACALAAFLLIR